MSEPIRTIIVVGVDYSVASERAMAMAWDLAEAAPSAQLHIIHVVEKRIGDADRDAEEKRVAALALAHARRATPESPPLREMVTHVWRGSPAEEIATLAAELDARLIVVGTHGHHGVSHLLLGSVAERLVRIAPCATLVVPPPERRQAAEALRIEPPCPQCMETRQKTNGRVFWCQRHRDLQERGHTVHGATRSHEPTSNSLLISTRGITQ